LRQEAKDRAAEAERAVEYAADVALLKRVYRRWSAVVVLQVSALNAVQCRITITAVQCLSWQSTASDPQP
jgi:hypothetical protein